MFGGQALQIIWLESYEWILRLLVGTHLGSYSRKLASYRFIRFVFVTAHMVVFFIGEQIAEETMELKAKELETATSKLASADALNLELKQTMHKLQQDVLKLRAALEQSITSLNRMSSDSDFYVDRFCS